MPDGALSPESACGPVPIAEILRTRSRHAASILRHEIEFSTLDWAGIADLASACSAVGLPLVSLRRRPDGVAICVLDDNGKADLQQVNVRLAGFDGLARWTVHIALGTNYSARVGQP